MRRSRKAEWVRTTVREHECALVRYATRLLGGDVERARDVVQDTFLRLWEADREAVSDHLAQWLFTVCRNRALDCLRKESRMSTMKDAQLRGQEDERAGPGLERGERGESCGRALQLLDDLPPRQQEAIRLKFQNGLSYKEISRVMETTVNNVGVLIHTGLKAMRGKLQSEPDASVTR